MTKRGNYRKNTKKNKRGITLVEPIIAIALVAIVVGAIISFQTFGMRTFGRGVSQADIQTSLRLSSDFIIREVRNASEIELDTPEDPDSYYQIYVSENKLKHKSPGGAELAKTDAIIADPATDISFSLLEVGSSYTLNFSIKGTSNSNSYTLASDVLLNNLRQATVLSDRQSLYYKK